MNVCAGFDGASDRVEWVVGAEANAAVVASSPAGVRQLVKKLGKIDAESIIMAEKPPKVALIALAMNLLTILNAMHETRGTGSRPPTRGQIGSRLIAGGALPEFATAGASDRAKTNDDGLSIGIGFDEIGAGFPVPVSDQGIDGELFVGRRCLREASSSSALAIPCLKAGSITYKESRDEG